MMEGDYISGLFGVKFIFQEKKLKIFLEFNIYFSARQKSQIFNKFITINFFFWEKRRFLQSKNGQNHVPLGMSRIKIFYTIKTISHAMYSTGYDDSKTAFG